MKILVTGAAGFIGFHLTKRLLDEGHDVFGIDNLNDYYDTDLKFGRLNELGINKKDINCDGHSISEKYSNFIFIKMDLTEKGKLDNLFEKEMFDVVVNLAAQAGVRYSIINPGAYIESNLIGFFNILEACRHWAVKHLVYASSSSVYGANTKIPYSESDKTDSPVSLYAATKKSNELMAYAYSHLYKIPATGLRFFTVYGPWGRPDMAPSLFMSAILKGETIKLFNSGEMERDFTYIDDIIEGIMKVISLPPDGDGLSSSMQSEELTRKTQDVDGMDAPHKVCNIGCSSPVKITSFLNVIERVAGKKAKVEMKEMQPGDVVTTYADISRLKNEYDYVPKIPIEEGIKSFHDWFVEYYKF